MTKKSGLETDPEILAITGVYNALKGLEADAQQRVLEYVSRKLHLIPSTDTHPPAEMTSADEGEALSRSTDLVDSAEADLDGISPVAKKWMKRNGLKADQLSSMFSLGVDEIDLVAKKVPGATKKDRMRSVFLLKGVAAYLGSGTARVSHDQIKEACLHYDAFDNTNFSKYLKTMSSEVSGGKEAGYTLTARGLTEATELIRKELTPKGSGG